MKSPKDALYRSRFARRWTWSQRAVMFEGDFFDIPPLTAQQRELMERRIAAVHRYCEQQLQRRIMNAVTQA